MEDTPEIDTRLREGRIDLSVGAIINRASVGSGTAMSAPLVSLL